MTFEPPVPFADGFDAAYGLDLDLGRAGEGVVHGTVPVHEALLADHGAVHGGVLASVAEATASTGTWVTVAPDGFAAMGLSNDTTVVGPVSSGTIHAEAVAVSRGEDTWVWTVEARDDTGATVAFSRITVAVRPMPG